MSQGQRSENCAGRVHGALTATTAVNIAGLLASCGAAGWDKKDVILKNEPEKLLKIQDRHPKTNRNEPENEAEKLLKIRSRGKNEPERS